VRPTRIAQTRTATRRTPVAVFVLGATILAVAAWMVAGGQSAVAHDHSRHATAGPVSANELALRLELRRLWHEHAEWTRLAIVSLTTDAPDTQATVARLPRNQTDIGNAVKPFYGARRASSSRPSGGSTS
jgi:hypothetical protein